MRGRSNSELAPEPRRTTGSASRSVRTSVDVETRVASRDHHMGSCDYLSKPNWKFPSKTAFVMGGQLTTTIPEKAVGLYKWSTRSVGICLKLHHKDVRRSKPETLFSISVVAMQLVKEMSLAQPVLCQGTELSAMDPRVPPWGYIHTYSLQSVQWRRGGRRIEPVPLRPAQIGSIACGDLFDAFLDARLCCC